jgi:pSer/pThr/pTyr-binding forkhead associated (FHA) protein
MGMHKLVKVTIEEKGMKRYVNIDSESFIIGRSVNTEVPIENDLISRQHIRVGIKENRIWVEDLGSSNGAWIDKQKLASGQRVFLTEESVLSLGSKSGPFVRIEFDQDEEIQFVPSLPVDFQYEKEVVGSFKKAVNGSDPLPLLKKSIPPTKEKLSLVNPAIIARVSLKKTEAEKTILEQIKNLMNIESDEINLVAIEEAKSITGKAEENAQVIIENANQEAEKKLTDAEKKINIIKTDTQLFENEAIERLESLKSKQDELTGNLVALSETESVLQKNLSKLQFDIKHEQEKIHHEKLVFDNDKKELFKSQKNLEGQYHDLQLEERKVKALIEVEMLEAKAKVSQISSAAEKAQVLKDTLEPEVHALKLHKHDLESALSEIKSQHNHLVSDLARLTQEFSMAHDKLGLTIKDQENTRKEIEQNRQAMFTLQEEIQRRDKESLLMSERVQKEAEENIVNARHQAKILLDQARDSSEKQLNEAKEELSKVFHEHTKYKIEVDKIKDETSRRMAAAHDEASKIIQKGSLKSELLINQAKEESEGIRKTANLVVENQKKESEHLLSATAKEALAIKDNANLYRTEKEKETQKAVDQIKIKNERRQNLANQELTKLEEKKKEIELQIHHLDNNYDERMAILTKESEVILDAARLDAQQLKVSLEANVQADFESHKQEVDNLRLEIEKQRKALGAQLDLEFKDLKQKQLGTLAEQRQVELFSIRDLKRKAEEEIQKSKQENARKVATEIYAMLASEMYKARNRVIDESFVEPMAEEIKDLVTDIMLDRPGAGSDKLQDLLKIKDRAKGKERIFWQKMVIGAGSLVVMIILIVLFPSLVTGPKNAISSAFTEKRAGQADAYVKMKVKEAKQRMIYNPPTTMDYKPHYADNVLFTTDFETRRMDQVFQDKWILELNDFFINGLDVKDTTIIKFVSLESSLLRDLAKLKSQVDPSNPEAKIQEMKQRESEFKEKLGKMFEDQSKVARYYEFSEKFWNEFYPAINN